MFRLSSGFSAEGAIEASTDLQKYFCLFLWGPVPVYSTSFQLPRRGRRNLSFLEATPVPIPRRATQQYHPFHAQAGGRGGYSVGMTPMPAASGTPNELVHWDPDPHARPLFEKIFGAANLYFPEFVPDSGDPEGYLRTTLGYIEQTGLQNFPHEILGSLQNTFGIGTPTGCVLDSCLEQAKEQARAIWRSQDNVCPHKCLQSRHCKKKCMFKGETEKTKKKFQYKTVGNYQ